MLFLIKWGADPTGPSFLTAENVTQLIETLDEVGDPFDASFRPYSGPIAFGLRMDEASETLGVEDWSGDTSGLMFECVELMLAEKAVWIRVADVAIDQWPAYMARMASATQEQLGITVPG